MSTCGGDQGDSLRHHGLDTALCQQIEKFRKRYAVPGVVLPEIRGQGRLLAVRDERQQSPHQKGKGNDPQPLLLCGSHTEPHQPPPFPQGSVRTPELPCGGLLPQPLLYLSAYFERYRDEYYQRLLEVSQHGNWEEWIIYFLRGITSQGRDAIRRSDQLLSLWQKYRNGLQEARASALLLQLIDELFTYPAITNSIAAKKLSVTPRAAQQNIERLQNASILREATGRRRNRIYVASEIISIIEQGEA